MQQTEHKSFGAPEETRAIVVDWFGASNYARHS